MQIILVLIGLVGAVGGAAMAAMAAADQAAPLAPAFISAGMVALVGGFLLIGLGAVVSRLTRLVDLLDRQSVMPAPAGAEKIEPVVRPREPAAASPAPEAPSVPAPAVIAEPAVPPAAEASKPGAPSEAPVVTAEPLAPPGESEPSLLDKTRDLFEKPVSDLPPVAPPVSAAPEPMVEPPAPPAREWPRVTPGDRFAEPRLDTPQTAAPPIVPPMERPPSRAERIEPTPPAPPLVSPSRGEAPVAAPERAQPAVLKSGVIEGMAYTLYSDGSIEAELAEGSMRFDSISALRAYLRDIG